MSRDLEVLVGCGHHRGIRLAVAGRWGGLCAGLGAERSEMLVGLCNSGVKRGCAGADSVCKLRGCLLRFYVRAMS